MKKKLWPLLIFGFGIGGLTYIIAEAAYTIDSSFGICSLISMLCIFVSVFGMYMED